MASKLSRFFHNGAGLEKTLRLIQSMAQIAAVFSVSSTAVRLTTTKLQLALSRRFFRFFGFLDSFQRVSTLLSNGEMKSVAGCLDLAQWTFFGLYFVLEDLTILHAMGVYAVSWEESVMREANKFWLYALTVSIVGSLYALLFAAPREAQVDEKVDEKKSCKAKKAESTMISTKTGLVKKIVLDSCDILIPISLLKWHPIGDLEVGITMVISTVWTGLDIWSQM
ncbi:hypothetical protein N7495_000023 [Penicillium taxi]|uniref:uncharacterized protein n=1 Tax=Penicillium taxi TaxID=168475 RepID=UPI002545614A|nr:uncharacterized protein N7495_000023 [Penicillium taxi]KAJ5907341.1 hypothetical protein N7495_000023 [Penicillium taxi]